MWYLDNISYIVTDMQKSRGQVIARLQPLASGTIYHAFGWDSPIVNLTGKVVGYSDLASLEALATTGEYYQLKHNTQDFGSYLVKTVKTTWDATIKQSLRQDLACDAPVFTCEIELYLET
jgi:hypothetical protein